ncbi:hypothetical protein PIB30_079983 [Stylosanthes scabra]|uniref:Putative plant transposon protein domain-containing protein n=1 Tax=Stylosanthes scabra TaxID=79078 RepID=A0ABU6QRX0_9FABA|nr:hypothetical protein [Stylosanthes scabra]
MLSARKVLNELIIEVNDEILSPCNLQIKARRWQKFTNPVQAVGHNMVKEFYANAWEPDKDKRKPYSYTTMVRGKDINFALSDIKRVLTLKKDLIPNVGSYHERKANKDFRLKEVQECLCIEGGEWVRHKDGRPHYLRRADLEPMTKGWYDFVCRSLIPTTNRSEVMVKRAVLIHSIIIGENINVEEIITDQIYKFVYKTDLSSSLPFPSVIALLCRDAKAIVPDDTMIPQEPPINGEAMIRVREPRAKNPKQARQEAPQQQQQPPQEQPQLQVQQQDFPSNFYTHFDNSMLMIYRRLDNQQEESRRSFEALNTRMDRFDDQLSYLCYSTQMTNEQMLSPYQDTTRLMREMKMQGIPMTMANLAIHRQKEEEMRQERMRYEQILQDVAAEKAREENKGKARMVKEEEDEDTDEEASSASEECKTSIGKTKNEKREKDSKKNTKALSINDWESKRNEKRNSKNSPMLYACGAIVSGKEAWVLKTGPDRPVEPVGPRTGALIDSVWCVKPPICKPPKNRRTGREPDGWTGSGPGRFLKM